MPTMSTTPKASRKRLVLAYPPLSMPTSPPLGMATLKGFIARELPDWEVVTLDLNLWFFRTICQKVGGGEIRLSDEMHQRLGADAATLAVAAQIFSGEHNDLFYDDSQAYDRCGEIFLNFMALFGKVLQAECAEWEHSGRLSAPLAEMTEAVDALSPDLVGLSVLFNQQIPAAAVLGRVQRSERGRTVIFGGGCFNRENVDFFWKWYPQAADAVVVGDGEEALKALLRQDGNAEGIAGVSRMAQGRVEQNDPEYAGNISAYGPPDFSELNPAEYFSPEPVVPLSLSRGCYWRRCTFCVHHLSAGHTYRLYPIDKTINMLRGLVDQGIRHFSFVDEMISPVRFRQLATAIRAANLDIAYYAMAKPDRSFSSGLLQEMAASGCRYILWGVESGHQRILDLMDKGTTVEDSAMVLHDACKAGIANHVFLICGFPSESREEWAASLDFLRAHQEAIHAVHRGLFGLEPGSPISRDPERFGIEQTWVRQDGPLGPRLAYRCSSGMSMEEAFEAFRDSLPLLRGFNPYSRYMANFRDHALLIYQNRGLGQGNIFRHLEIKHC